MVPSSGQSSSPSSAGLEESNQPLLSQSESRGWWTRSPTISVLGGLAVMALAAVLLDKVHWTAAAESKSDSDHNKPAVPKGSMELRMMPDKGLNSLGAVCLDGSDAGFYFSKASAPEHANDWQIYFGGGGWCYDEADCLGRSSGFLGSSDSWAESIGPQEGIMSGDCKVNPTFCNFNRVWLAYCDGNSFTGNRDQPVMVSANDGKPPKALYFRGRRILDAVLDTVFDEMGLGKAENVILTGCSAGGLAALLHADYVHSRLQARAPSLQKFRAVPISGFFLLHSNVLGEEVFAAQMQTIFELSNSSGGVNSKCVAANPGKDAWKCNFASTAYAFTLSTPVFLLNSALDNWQVPCIYTAQLPVGFPNQIPDINGNCSAVPGWENCSRDVEACSEAQVPTLNAYIQDFNSTLQSTATYHKTGNGAFIHSCETHCEAQSRSWNTFAIHGVTLQQAVSTWWNSDDEPASAHCYTPCLYHLNSPRACNPTCMESLRPESAIVV
ncbi:unnamed protein product [Polarella glacialis]|uniref:Pectin acetylesterase n=1 Tax=Polarella glacialis TaxID=89957 RepID=A0A813HVS9_POLGL|nr:unnamed protein product [Polarella glacialis]